MKHIPKGIISAMLTPMNEDESVSLPLVRKNVERLISSGVHALFSLGTTAEFYTLTDSEKLSIVETVLDQTAGRVPVYAGTGTISTKDVIKLTKQMEKYPLAGVSVITPYFVGLNQDELYEHYKAIAAETSLPVIMYNIPARTGLNIDAATVARLAEIDNIVGIKDSSGKFDNIKAYIEATKDLEFSVLAGSDGLILDALLNGGTGAIAATTNCVPELVVSIYELFLKGNIEEARKAQQELQILRDGLSLGSVPGVLKQSANLMGFEVGPVRAPVKFLTGKKLDELCGYLSHYNKDLKR